jgi:E3 ubiquitin-protein ligase RNF144
VEKREAEDLETLKLLKSQNWRRCPECRAIVERTEGCPHISCRCGTNL